MASTEIGPTVVTALEQSTVSQKNSDLSYTADQGNDSHSLSLPVQSSLYPWFNLEAPVYPMYVSKCVIQIDRAGD